MRQFFVFFGVDKYPASVFLGFFFDWGCVGVCSEKHIHVQADTKNF